MQSMRHTEPHAPRRVGAALLLENPETGAHMLVDVLALLVRREGEVELGGLGHQARSDAQLSVLRNAEERLAFLLVGGRQVSTTSSSRWRVTSETR